MHVVITGGAGFIGKKLAGALLARGALETASGRQAIDKLTLFDMTRAEGLPDDARVAAIAGDITDLAAVHQAIRDNVDGVFHLAAIVSANAEEDFDLGSISRGRATCSRPAARCRSRRAWCSRARSRSTAGTCPRCWTTAPS